MLLGLEYETRGRQQHAPGTARCVPAAAPRDTAAAPSRRLRTAPTNRLQRHLGGSGPRQPATEQPDMLRGTPPNHAPHYCSAAAMLHGSPVHGHLVALLARVHLQAAGRGNTWGPPACVARCAAAVLAWLGVRACTLLSRRLRTSRAPCRTAGAACWRASLAHHAGDPGQRPEQDLQQRRTGGGGKVQGGTGVPPVDAQCGCGCCCCCDCTTVVWAAKQPRQPCLALAAIQADVRPQQQGGAGGALTTTITTHRMPIRLRSQLQPSWTGRMSYRTTTQPGGGGAVGGLISISG